MRTPKGLNGRTIIGALVAVGAGSAGLLLGVGWDDEGAAERSPTAFDVIAAEPPGPADIVDPDPMGEVIPPPASTPDAAVRAFLDAEVRGDLAASFGALSAATRAEVGSLDAWMAGRGERPRYLSYETVPDEPLGTSVVLQPRLDEVAGMVPGRAIVDWAVVAEDGGWRVDLDGTESRAVLPSDESAAEAALAWARARQDCRPAGEYEGSLLLSPTLADGLCERAGRFTAEPAAALETLPDAAPVIAAFGGEATEWARVVRIHGPDDLAVVTAPLGDTWVVVGVSPG